jgi:UDP-N-acetylmuramoyl-tripeptide--D-alanyl-D-alanine ligase
MTELFLFFLAGAWLIGAWLRVYRQARFFQIEEYMNGRYVRWWLKDTERVLPRRPLVAFGLGAVLAFFLSEAPGSPLPAIIALIAAVAAVWPPDQGEIKKAFNRTGRATRILAAAFAVALVDYALYAVFIALVGIADYELQVIALAGPGLLVFLSAPLFLVVGNVLMTPVEALLRRRYIQSARAVLAAIQPRVIGITGSYGKTTTKTFVTEILNGRFRAYPTPKSFNTMMGVCLAINRDLAHDYSVEYFVVEMGAYVRGEIQRICSLTPPDISIVTEVGPQHLERFGSLENIKHAKYEIIRNLPPDGVGVFNWDNPYVRWMYEQGYPQTRLAVSKTADPATADGPRFIATDISESLDGLRFTVHDCESGNIADFETPVLGLHNVTNILCATAVAVHEGMSLDEVAFRVKRLQPAESRLVRQTTANGITIINDAYSANPAGVLSSLRVLAMHQGGRRLLVTPGMVELGDLHEQENRRLGEIAAEHATDIILVGQAQTQPIYDGLQAVDFPADRLHVVEELHEAMDWYQTHLQPGDTVLFLNDLPDTY